MDFRKAVSFVLLVFAFAFVAANARADSSSIATDDGISSPQVEFNANGDQASHYPPYFHNDK